MTDAPDTEDTVQGSHRWWALPASVLLPMLLYVATASPGPYWLDSSELVAASELVGVPHPPGHPLWVAASQLSTLFPFSGPALRVNLTSALFAALSCGVLFDLVEAFGRRLRMRPWLAASLGLVAACLVASSYAVWFQAVRAEVYTLHLLVAASAVSLATRMHWQADAGEEGDPRLLLGLGLCAGLGGANHHYLMLFVLAPIGLSLLARGAWRRRIASRFGLGAVGLALVGLAVYVLLPLAAARDPLVNWGSPDSVDRFVWVVTAQAFQGTLERAAEVDAAALLFDLFGQMARQLTPVGLVLGGAGLALLGLSRRWGVALMWAGVIAANLLTQSLFNFDPFNPDVHGYFALSVWTLGLSAAAGVATFFHRTARMAARGERPGVARLAGWSGLVAFTLLLPLNLALTAEDASRRHFADVELTNRAMLEPLPEGSLVLTSNYKTLFDLWYAQGVAHQRTDVTAVHRNFFPNAPYIAQLERRHPELLDLPEGGGGSTRVDVDALRAEAAGRPVYVEVDVNLQEDLLPYLEPAGLLFRVRPEPLPPGPVPRDVGRDHVQRWLDLEDAILERNAGGALDLETQRHIVWSHYTATLALVKREHDVLAQFHLDRAMAINPASPELAELQQRVLEMREGRGR